MGTKIIGMKEYMDFTREKGKSLSTMNPGSNEFALTVPDALHALDLIKNTRLAVLGGDIVTEKENKLMYAYQLWGKQYIYLNWHCTQKQNETLLDYNNRSYIMSYETIIKASDIAGEKNNPCYIVLAVGGSQLNNHD